MILSVRSAFFERGIELDSKASAAYYSLGNLYYVLEHYQDAAKQFEKAIANGLIRPMFIS